MFRDGSRGASGAARRNRSGNPNSSSVFVLPRSQGGVYNSNNSNNNKHVLGRGRVGGLRKRVPATAIHSHGENGRVGNSPSRDAAAGHAWSSHIFSPGEDDEDRNDGNEGYHQEGGEEEKRSLSMAESSGALVGTPMEPTAVSCRLPFSAEEQENQPRLSQGQQPPPSASSQGMKSITSYFKKMKCQSQSQSQGGGSPKFGPGDLGGVRRTNEAYDPKSNGEKGGRREEMMRTRSPPLPRKRLGETHGSEHHQFRGGGGESSSATPTTTAIATASTASPAQRRQKHGRRRWRRRKSI